MSFTLSVFNAPWKGEKEVTLERGEALTYRQFWNLILNA